MKPLFYNAKELLINVPKVDFHVHTTYSDGQSDIQDCIKAAEKLGLEKIAFTDHVNKTTDWFLKFKKEIIESREKQNKIKIYYGLEVRDVDFEGNLNADNRLVDEAEIVIGVVHSYPALERDNALDIEFKMALALLSNPKVDVLGHPGATYEKFFGKFPLNLYRELIRQAKKYNKAIEINAQYQKNLKEFVKMCLEENCLVSLGSDAHKANELGRIYYNLKEALSNL